MENRIVLFSNIKGGVGKTTLCALFASYLAEKGIPVFAMDADLQASLYRHRQREKNVDPDTSAPWAVEMLNTSDAADPDREATRCFPVLQSLKPDNCLFSDCGKCCHRR